MKYEKYIIQLMFLMPLSASCMQAGEEGAVEVVEQVELSNSEIAKKAVQLVYGKDNDYLERMLTRKLEGKKKVNRNIPIRKVVRSSQRQQLKRDLSTECKRAQQQSVDTLTKDSADQALAPLPENSQPIVQWVMNSLLSEKLKDREHLINSDYWKYINGSLAVILPAAVGLVEYFLVHRFGCNSNSSAS